MDNQTREKSKKIITKIKRSDFVSKEAEVISYFDVALPIGFGQTISQPSTVEHMLCWLDIHKGMKVMDVGSGSGWTTALLASLVGEKGHVYAVEKIPELVEYGRSNCQRYGFENIEFYESGTELGLPLFAPFDRILVSASARQLPQSLIYQLKSGGRMVIPVRNDILEITKVSDENLNIKSHHGYAFVPLVA